MLLLIIGVMIPGLIIPIPFVVLIVVGLKLVIPIARLIQIIPIALEPRSEILSLIPLVEIVIGFMPKIDLVTWIKFEIVVARLLPRDGARIITMIKDRTWTRFLPKVLHSTHC